jgi:hypothetical protein
VGPSRYRDMIRQARFIIKTSSLEPYLISLEKAH